ncbi:23S rRNA (uracil(1939)-C(5))-methyltransferase RlmD [Erwinia sp. HDF1-3R]|uniref:23S rRNA (uracil(1939)-C(5))-methyltransferase RlmD n=1 Tax=Erwinia sp. HDF1-3R TaxID=3141543 RepID=UPI0031F57FB9
MAQFYSAKRRVTTRQIVTTMVYELDGAGQGVARHNGKALFINGALPGEQVEVEIVEDKRAWARGNAKRLLSTSPERVTPACPHFSQCGGCSQQHASPALQQRSKAQSLARMLGQATGQPVEVTQIIAGEAYGYRRRARLGLSWHRRSQTLQMGFRRSSSDELVNITQCPVLKPELEALINPLHQVLSSLQASDRLGHVELIQADNGTQLVLRHLDPLGEEDRRKLERFSHNHQIALYLAPDSDTLEQVSGEMPYYRLDDLTLTFSPRGFIQVNAALNQQMVHQALAWLDLHPQDRVLDLFCGMGNFSLPMGNYAESVIGVEGVTALVEKGAYNAALNNLNHVTFYQHNLEEDVAQQPWAAQGFNKVLLDPARAGAAGVMNHIIKLAPERVVYVSCNPTTLARDCQILLTAGYQLERVTLLDMFPHTGHVESMVLFSRK